MSKDDKGKKPKEIYILKATYKENDPETIGAYDSVRAMMRGFAKCIAEEVLGTVSNFMSGKTDVIKIDDLHEVARTLADLIPAFFDDDYPRDEDGYISYGRTRYGYEVLTVESVEQDGDRDDEDEP